MLRPHPPWVTGAYQITSPAGVDKLTGILQLRDALANDNRWLRHDWTVEQFTKTLSKTWCMGPFLAYEVATDLRHTWMLRDAPDINTWANPGPGALRGLARLRHNSPERARWPSRAEGVGMMVKLLAISRTAWKHEPELELREIEHSLCEFDKYERVRMGQGAPRGRYHAPPNNAQFAEDQSYRESPAPPVAVT